jgi:hypothetical protein
MIKAQDLINEQTKRENKKYLIFDKIYNSIEKKILIASNVNYYETCYELPEFIMGFPLYSLNECGLYIKNKLIENGFSADIIHYKLVYISWAKKT